MYRKQLQLQTGGTLTVTGDGTCPGNITYGGTSITIGDDSTDRAKPSRDPKRFNTPDDSDRYSILVKHMIVQVLQKDLESAPPIPADSVKASGLVYLSVLNLQKMLEFILTHPTMVMISNAGNNRWFSPISISSVATDGDLIYIRPDSIQETFHDCFLKELLVIKEIY